MRIENNVFLIISKDRKMIAKGVPRDRYICHIDEKDRKRVLTYSSKKLAENGFQKSGFFLSDYVKEYIEREYPELKTEWLSWRDIKHLFEARKFTVNYEFYEN